MRDGVCQAPLTSLLLSVNCAPDSEGDILVLQNEESTYLDLSFSSLAMPVEKQWCHFSVSLSLGCVVSQEFPSNPLQVDVRR